MNQSLAKLEDWRINVKYNLRRNLGNVLKLLKETDHRLVNMAYQGLCESTRRIKASKDNKNRSSALMVRLCRKLTDSAFTLTHQAMQTLSSNSKSQAQAGELTLQRQATDTDKTSASNDRIKRARDQFLRRLMNKGFDWQHHAFNSLITYNAFIKQSQKTIKRTQLVMRLTDRGYGLQLMGFNMLRGWLGFERGAEEKRRHQAGMERK